MPVAFKPINPISSINGYALAPGFYDAFEHASDEDNKQALLDAWATKDQQIFNLMHKTCESCNGRGYHQHRTKTGKVIRESVGCQECMGTGSVPKLWVGRI
jgi:hypothetical protein